MRIRVIVSPDNDDSYIDEIELPDDLTEEQIEMRAMEVALRNTCWHYDKIEEISEDRKNNVFYRDP